MLYYNIIKQTEQQNDERAFDDGFGALYTCGNKGKDIIRTILLLFVCNGSVAWTIYRF